MPSDKIAIAQETRGLPFDRLRQEAWIGDAILLLFARTYVLQTTGSIDDAQCTRMTSNRFLNIFANPTTVEAEIGRIYQQQGLAAAMAWIEEQLLPRFIQQEQNRRAVDPRGRSGR